MALRLRSRNSIGSRTSITRKNSKGNVSKNRKADEIWEWVVTKFNQEHNAISMNLGQESSPLKDGSLQDTKAMENLSSSAELELVDVSGGKDQSFLTDSEVMGQENSWFDCSEEEEILVGRHREQGNLVIETACFLKSSVVSKKTKNTNTGHLIHITKVFRLKDELISAGSSSKFKRVYRRKRLKDKTCLIRDTIVENLLSCFPVGGDKGDKLAGFTEEVLAKEGVLSGEEDALEEVDEVEEQEEGVELDRV
uniref:Uncharacterized protein n=1 Tax=Nelumbo nucifera TaxID=4432 RepID=A0A822ZK35_NELNU|nr:TPA_asm: hypothetical protein HUJ06_002191 [Nelumbo nucifera]